MQLASIGKYRYPVYENEGSDTLLNVAKLTIPTPFKVGPVNVYLLKGDLLTLVDTGAKTAEAREELLQQLKILGYTPEDIEQVVLTHHHPDHVGFVEELFSHARIVGHQKCDPWLKKDKQFLASVTDFFTDFYQEHGVPIELVEKIKQAKEYFLSFTGEVGLTDVLSDGQEVSGLPGWKVVETLGHAQSHISLFHEGERTMIAGDHIIAHISSNAILEAPYTNKEKRPRTLLQYRAALNRCLELDVMKVYSGHGKDIELAAPLIRKRLDEHIDKAQKLKTLIPDNGITSFQLCQQYFAHIYKKEPGLTLSEIIGHLDLLELEGEIVQKKIAGERLYFKNE